MEKLYGCVLKGFREVSFFTRRGAPENTLISTVHK